MNAIKLELQDQVAKLIIDNPRRRNALSRSMWRDITQLATSLADANTACVLVLQSSTAGCFAAGADIAEFEDNYANIETTRVVNTEIHDAIDAIGACPMPSLALIDGPCVGGGLALALGCDFRIASANARFALTPSRLGLSYHPDDVRRLLEACGQSNASELLFGAQSWSADRALQAGLVNSVHPATEYDEHAAQLINAICANSKAANRVLKQTISSVHSLDPDAINQSERAFDALFASHDFIAGRDAFLSKRQVQFPSNKSTEEISK